MANALLKSDIRYTVATSITPVPNRADQEFLPADLEILETPPSPIRMSLILLISAFVAIAIGWSWVGHIDVIAIAHGKIEPQGRVKLIQPLETGKVAAIHVENGQSVHAGDILIDMESGEAQAEVTAVSEALTSARAEILRRKAALAAARMPTISEQSAINWSNDIPDAYQKREEHVLTGDLAQLATSVASIDAQIHQKQVERDRFVETIEAQGNLIATLTERVSIRTAVVTTAGGSKASVMDSLEALQTQRTVLTTQKSQHDMAVANIDVLASDRNKTIAGFVSDNSQRLAEAQKRVDDLEQKLAKAKLQVEHKHLVSPIDGTVSGLSVTTVGQVLASVQEVMRIVPEGATLEIEAYLANQDIGFVRPGQTAIVKISSFPFMRYGTITAEVMRVAHDAIPEPDALQAEAGSPIQKSTLATGGQHTQNLVFPVTLALKTSTMSIDGQAVSLKPGMEVSVEVTTGNRRILSYVLSPLAEITSNAIKER